MSRGPYHAVICLANLMDIDGLLNEETEARLSMACKIVKKHEATLVTTGWDYRSDTCLQISVAMRDHAIRNFAMSPGQVMVETRARDTVGDAVFTRMNIATGRSWRNIHVVTSDYHVERTQEIFSFVYGSAAEVSTSGAVSQAGSSKIEGEVSSLRAFRETFDGINRGDIMAIHRRLLELHPFYRADALPKM